MDFFNEYGSWIIFGGLAFFMFRMHGKGGCCGGGQHDQNHDKQDKMTDEERQKNNKSGCH